MRTLTRVALASAVVFALAVAVAALLIWQLPPIHGRLAVGSETVVLDLFDVLDTFDGRHAVLGVALGIAAVIGAVVATVVAVVLGLGAAVLGIAVAALVVAAGVAVAASPLLLVAGLLWLLVRERRPAAAPAQGAVRA